MLFNIFFVPLLRHSVFYLFFIYATLKMNKISVMAKYMAIPVAIVFVELSNCSVANNNEDEHICK